MQKVILDTTTALEFINYLDEGDISRHTDYNAIYTVIEALILYEKILYDNVEFTYPIDFTQISVTRHFFTFNKMLDFVEPLRNEELDKTINLIKIKQSIHRFDSVFRLSSAIDPLEQHINDQIHYFSTMQTISNANLILHPRKRILFDDRNLKIPLSIEKNIIDNIDKSVRQQYLTDNQKWFLEKDLFIEVPMLAAYILKNSRNTEELLTKICEIRQSRAAVDFRDGIWELQKAIIEKDNITLTKTLQEINSAINEWKKNINYKPALKRGIKINLTSILPFLSLDIPIPYLGNSISDKLLTFIHLIKC